MPSSSLPVMCRSTISKQHAQAQSLHNQAAHALAINIKIHDYGKEEIDAYMFQ